MNGILLSLFALPLIINSINHYAKGISKLNHRITVLVVLIHFTLIKDP
jgi:hypothetical protein